MRVGTHRFRYATVGDDLYHGPVRCSGWSRKLSELVMTVDSFERDQRSACPWHHPTAPNSQPQSPPKTTVKTWGPWRTVPAFRAFALRVRKLQVQRAHVASSSVQAS